MSLADEIEAEARWVDRKDDTAGDELRRIAARVRALEGALQKVEEALEAITQGSTIRAYGIAYQAAGGERRQSIALTETQQEKIKEALRAIREGREK